MVTNIDGSGYNYTDITGYEKVRIKEHNYGTTIADFSYNRVDIGKPIYLAEGIDIDSDQQLATKAYVDANGGGTGVSIANGSTVVACSALDTIDQSIGTGLV